MLLYPQLVTVRFTLLSLQSYEILFTVISKNKQDQFYRNNCVVGLAYRLAMNLSRRSPVLSKFALSF